MTPELTYLFFTALLLIIAWIPHILGQIMTAGMLTRSDYTNLRRQSDFPAWVRRANRAHVNLVEQFAAFATLVLMAHMLQVTSDTMVLACAVYFWSRVVHFIIFIAGVNVLMARTMIFTVSFLALIVFAWGLWQGAS